MSAQSKPRVRSKKRGMRTQKYINRNHSCTAVTLIDPRITFRSHTKRKERLKEWAEQDVNLSCKSISCPVGLSNRIQCAMNCNDEPYKIIQLMKYLCRAIIVNYSSRKGDLTSFYGFDYKYAMDLFYWLQIQYDSVSFANNEVYSIGVHYTRPQLPGCILLALLDLDCIRIDVFIKPPKARIGLHARPRQFTCMPVRMHSVLRRIYYSDEHRNSALGNKHMMVLMMEYLGVNASPSWLNKKRIIEAERKKECAKQNKKKRAKKSIK
jgi:hypothetical protein